MKLDVRTCVYWCVTSETVKLWLGIGMSKGYDVEIEYWDVVNYAKLAMMFRLD